MRFPGVDAMVEADVLGRAIQNFQARNGRADRAWSVNNAHDERPILILSEVERAEFMEHARHELEVELRSAVAISFANRAVAAQIQSQGQSL
jgi:hypothetical protein